MSDPCIIKGCMDTRRLNSYLCPVHDEMWRDSPERKRAKDIDTAHHTLTMLSDFVTRVSAEQGKTS